MAEEPDPPNLGELLSEELFRAGLDLPAVQAAQAEGRIGPLSIPPGERAEMLEKQLNALLSHLPGIVRELDLLRWKVYRLEQAVEGEGDEGPRPVA